MIDTRIVDRKRAMRLRYLRLRSELGAAERAHADSDIRRVLVGLPEWSASDVILSYLSFGDEVDTLSIIRYAWQTGKQVALPRCTPGTRDMRWFVIDDFDGLVRSPFGVDEPEVDPEREVHLDALTPCLQDYSQEDEPVRRLRALALVPGLVFDDRGQRLGYGGGFYDTFIARREGLTGGGFTAVGLCRPQQRVADLGELGCLDACDRCVDRVVL